MSGATERNLPWEEIESFFVRLANPSNALLALREISAVIEENESRPPDDELSRLVSELCECSQNRHPRIASSCFNLLAQIAEKHGEQFYPEIARTVPVCVHALGRGGTVRTSSLRLLVACANVEQNDPKTVLNAVAAETSGAGEVKLRGESCMALQNVHMRSRFASPEDKFDALQDIVTRALIIALADESSQVRAAAGKALDAVRWHDETAFRTCVESMPPSDQELINKRVGPGSRELQHTEDISFPTVEASSVHMSISFRQSHSVMGTLAHPRPRASVEPALEAAENPAPEDAEQREQREQHQARRRRAQGRRRPLAVSWYALPQEAEQPTQPQPAGSRGDGGGEGTDGGAAAEPVAEGRRGGVAALTAVQGSVERGPSTGERGGEEGPESAGLGAGGGRRRGREVKDGGDDEGARGDDEAKSPSWQQAAVKELRAGGGERRVSPGQAGTSARLGRGRGSPREGRRREVSQEHRGKAPKELEKDRPGYGVWYGQVPVRED